MAGAVAGSAATAAFLASPSSWDDDEDFYHHSNWLEPDDPFYTEYESGAALFEQTYGDHSTDVNPATGLPMMDDSIDIHGNPYGTDINEPDLELEIESFDSDPIEIDDSFMDSSFDSSDSFDSCFGDSEW